MEWFGLQKLTAGWTVKNPKNRYPQKVLMPTDRILDMSQKISKMKNVYLYTIAELTYLFVDIKHMRPVTDFPWLTSHFDFRRKWRCRWFQNIVRCWNCLTGRKTTPTRHRSAWSRTANTGLRSRVTACLSARARYCAISNWTHRGTSDDSVKPMHTMITERMTITSLHRITQNGTASRSRPYPDSMREIIGQPSLSKEEYMDSLKLIDK